MLVDVLRAKGIGIAVDDFGTGYSSMTYLRQLHIDAIKMDRSFISRVEHSGYDRTIVDIILQLGHTLHLEVVAEGIETPEQLAILRQQGCDRAQGYLFARPMPIDLLESWLTSSVGAPAGRR
jgi:EAL domain-containing protein (putative c-di-GMP-specific phosphodiesterase class I)